MMTNRRCSVIKSRDSRSSVGLSNNMKKFILFIIEMLVIAASLFIGYELLQHSNSYADDMLGIFIPSIVIGLIYDTHKYRD